MPPKKTAKRGASAPMKGPKAAKQLKSEEKDAPIPDYISSVLTCGQGDVGQLGLGENVVEKTRPAAIQGYQDIVAIAAGGMHSVCLTMSGKVLTFGCNDEGALGRDTSNEGSEACPGFVTLPKKAIQVTAGDSHSAALLDDGSIYAWGSFRDSHGGMGLTIRGKEQLPTEILPMFKVTKIASGTDHLVMLIENGYVYTCGCGEQGQLGRLGPRSANRNSRRGLSALLTPGLVEFKITRKIECNDIWAGSYCTFAKHRQKGDIYAFGLNNYYQLGLEDTAVYYFPQRSKIFSGRTWKRISSGQHHSVALDDMGQVFVIGRKEYGRLGLGPQCSDAKELILVPGLSSMKCVDIATGTAQSFAVTDSGKMYSWGMGSSGQLGTGNESDAEEPVLVQARNLEGQCVIAVSGGGQHTMILAVPNVRNENSS
ncbi:regulator of chromosome condensation isoform X3 [Orussus abietinus]|uniref:regulator of chromosome condensation isoform X3 n=1 Tax=Orussus abietinus TaxID=222816 RepID=UPI00062671AA|nr:regulator of chromosome condensation isoform X3 [Orussus abietinus]XP_012278111.1 regulator of chromosome condensation isoform X3 [Orussus abietinus]XP_012278112.1 regulator of chromosome condensation isoform X3 [Orussus abietinus]